MRWRSRRSALTFAPDRGHGDRGHGARPRDGCPRRHCPPCPRARACRRRARRRAVARRAARGGLRRRARRSVGRSTGRRRGRSVASCGGSRPRPRRCGRCGRATTRRRRSSSGSPTRGTAGAVRRDTVEAAQRAGPRRRPAIRDAAGGAARVARLGRPADRRRPRAAGRSAASSCGSRSTALEPEAARADAIVDARGTSPKTARYLASRGILGGSARDRSLRIWLPTR